MKFNKLRILFALKIFSFLLFIITSVWLSFKKDKKKVSSAFFSPRCIDYNQKDYSRRLNDRIIDYSDAAKLSGVKVSKDEKELLERISEGKLVKMRSTNSYIVEKMRFSYPLLTRGSKNLINEIADRLRDKCSQKGLNGVRLYITSMTRKSETIKNLRRFNGNASLNSPHLYGNAFDISYKRFVARKWRLTNCDKKFLKEALAEVIWQLRAEKKCWATYEKVQNCFHVVAR